VRVTNLCLYRLGEFATPAVLLLGAFEGLKGAVRVSWYAAPIVSRACLIS
jgi:hypothetical protein